MSCPFGVYKAHLHGQFRRTRRECISMRRLQSLAQVTETASALHSVELPNNSFGTGAHSR